MGATNFVTMYGNADKMTVAQALCTAETMDPKFGAVQGHP